MAKYPNITDGQHEAIVNKIGGLLGVKILLDGKFPDDKMKLTPTEKAQLMFAKMYEKAVAIRHLFRAWGKYKYTDTKGYECFSVILTSILNRAGNIAAVALKDFKPMEQSSRDALIADIDTLLGKIIEFRVQEGLECMFAVTANLSILKQSLQKNDMLAAYRQVFFIEGFKIGMETTNDLFLSTQEQ